MVSIRLLISKSSSSCINSLVTVPRAPITIGINVTFIFYSLFNSLARSISRDSKVHNFLRSLLSLSLLLLLLLLLLLYGLVVWPRLSDPFGCQNPIRVFFCVSFSKTDVGLCIHHLLVWANLNFLHNSQWISFIIIIIIIISIGIFHISVS